MALVQSYGNVEGIIKNVLMSNGATQQDPNGRFYIDGQMVHVDLARAIAEAIYLFEVYQNGLNCTARYTDDTKPGGAVRVPLEMPFAPSSRTLSFGGRKGTDGNDGLFNKNEPILPTTDEFLIYTNQLNDQDIIFPDIAKEFVPLDLMVNKIKGYGKSVAQDRTASTTAEVLLYNIFRALNGAENIIDNFDGTQDFAYGELIAKLNALLTDGDPVTGALTFPTEGRCVIGRASFVYGIFAKAGKSGVILNGSDLSQRMLKEYDLNASLSERRYVGEGYKGEFGGLHFVVMPDQLWTWAERYMGLAKGALDQVQAVCLSADSLALGRAVDLGVKLQDATYPYPRGIMARPINLWGHEMFRKAFIIAKGTFTTDNLKSLGFSENERRYPVAPKSFADNANKKITVPVYGADGTVVAYQEIAQGQEPSGDNWRSGLDKVAAVVASVKGGSYASAQSVTLTSATSDATIYYTTDGSTPTSKSTKYTAAISVAASETIKAIAVKNGLIPSDVMSETYTITA